MKRLKRVLLIDDYEADNFMHEMLFEEMGCADEIVVKLNGREALDYLTTPQQGQLPRPDLICLDINMPVMNGWEFLAAYEALDEDMRGGVVLMMLTTSLNPDDKSLADSNEAISDFVSKPLTREALGELLSKHFPDLEV
ncbi:response regulator receiver [Oceanococcus atlanticus]|uniref:Response regulator receiver n=1 Tax=Oceanococcus atlanticus TaxID=1317117 RepID=A0A1Y1SEF5_9GAMM|nr:response regulator [Oceanococcus atlanticus]ORE87074.1 response regulator receiver [Oceanococcus atlanticus]RZO86823.1 MAG: response regulator [Oceanococcus sp.]